jgi:hypothetical protein
LVVVGFMPIVVFLLLCTSFNSMGAWECPVPIEEGSYRLRLS